MSIKKYFYKLTNNFLNTFFPEQCLGCSSFLIDREIAFCSNCINSLSYVNYSNVCEICFSKKHKKNEINCIIHTNLDRNISLLHLDDNIKKFLYEIKYYFRKRLFISFLNNIKKINLFDEKPEIIIPVPLHKSRLRWRTFNQADILAKWLSDITMIPVNYNALKRIKKTISQTKQKAINREENIKNAFVLDTNFKVFDNIMLVDDVLTTGATLSECAKILKENGAKRVISFTLIRA